MANDLKTGWVIIANSGKTADGRNIEKEWLTSMAEHYSPSLYTALIWPDHRRSFGSFGKVLALKTEPSRVPELEGEISLYAILAPNQFGINANNNGQLKYCSIEVTENFLDRGHYYLEGLAFTDQPASVGTSELRFCENNKNTCFIGNQIELKNLEPYQPHDFISKGTTMADENTNTSEDLKSLITEFKAEIENFKSLDFSKSNESEEESGSDLHAVVTDLKGELESLREEFTKLKTTPVDGTQIPEHEGEEEII